MLNFSIQRTFSVAEKEMLKLIRNTALLAMLVAVPLLQVIIYGEAINLEPKHISTAVLNVDHSPFTQRFLHAMEQSQFFQINYFPQTEAQALELIKTGKVKFILQFPTDFTRELIRGNRPSILLQADATNPVAISQAISVVDGLSKSVFDDFFIGPLQHLKRPQASFDVNVQLMYNPNRVTIFLLAPNLIGIILTFVMTTLTSTSLVEESTQGTIEALLNTPLKRAEILIGKISPYILVGYLQMATLLIALVNLYHLPIQNNIWTLFIATLPFIMANLMVGLVMAAVSKDTLQASQINAFYQLPSVLLSGFVFPFDGMPKWAQVIGNLLPVSHYMRITSGVLLKNYNWQDVWLEMWPIILFFLVMLILGTLLFKKTLH